MPDISMCSGEGCPMRSRCYRAQATPSGQRQSYFATPPVKVIYAANSTTPMYRCDHYWHMDDEERA